jgi:hypothetical protein
MVTAPVVLVLVVPSLSVAVGVIIIALRSACVCRSDGGTVTVPSPARLVGQSSTKLLFRIAQLIELLFMQEGQFLVLLSGIVTVNNFAGSNFLCTENALAAVLSATSMATATIAGPAGALSCPKRGHLMSKERVNLPLLEFEAYICFLHSSEGRKAGRVGVDRRSNSIKALVRDPILKPEDL